MSLRLDVRACRWHNTTAIRKKLNVERESHNRLAGDVDKRSQPGFRESSKPT
jgi:hypothetical protein